MLISSTGKYALSLMMDLAEHNKGEPVRLKDVAKRQGISLKYLERIAGILKRDGLVNSYRGFFGGYKIKYEPQKYTVGMILRATELNFFVEQAGDIITENIRNCDYAASFICNQIMETVNEIVDSITLQDLLNLQEQWGDHYII